MAASLRRAAACCCRPVAWAVFDVGFGLGGAGLGAVSSASASRCLILSVSSAASPRMLWALLSALMLARPLRQPYEHGGEQK